MVLKLVIPKNWIKVENYNISSLVNYTRKSCFAPVPVWKTWSVCSVSFTLTRWPIFYLCPLHNGFGSPGLLICKQMQIYREGEQVRSTSLRHSFPQQNLSLGLLRPDWTFGIWNGIRRSLFSRNANGRSSTLTIYRSLVVDRCDDAFRKTFGIEEDNLVGIFRRT